MAVLEAFAPSLLPSRKAYELVSVSFGIGQFGEELALLSICLEASGAQNCQGMRFSKRFKRGPG